jgi:hypothetical protein
MIWADPGIRTLEAVVMSVRRQSSALLALTAIVFSQSVALAEKPSLLKMFGREAPSQSVGENALELTEEDGPWLILASTFVGEGSQKRAERLADEIRKELNLPAYIYREKFDFTGTINEGPTTSRRLRYANRYQYEAYAVLVGEYDTVAHPDIERDLKRVRTATPPIFQDAKEVAAETDRSTPVTTVKSITNKIFGQAAKEGKLKGGPMSQAFVTRNPMLPEEYFMSPPVDSFVRQMNEGLHHSLLECEGKYTVIVKTFEGLGDIVDGKRDDEFKPSESRLNKFAADAEKMTLKLRAKGVEAYQFHDRNRSIVTVGSFDELGRELPDGGFEYAQQIRAVMKEYSAFNVAPELARQVPAGAPGVASNNVDNIPFDVQPTPIAVPRVSKRSLYGAALGMR